MVWAKAAVHGPVVGKTVRPRAGKNVCAQIKIKKRTDKEKIKRTGEEKENR
jgi:hypothetical protein